MGPYPVPKESQVESDRSSRSDMPILNREGLYEIRLGVSSIEAAHPIWGRRPPGGYNACPAGIPMTVPLEEAERRRGYL
ncbi:hypothetical protein TPY_1075 [Sulfobacillus acidophilus TPY]|nr:hypothetical protein TPY_1075 [Sulfobacillus acidophilus TPY]